MDNNKVHLNLNQYDQVYLTMARYLGIYILFGQTPYLNNPLKHTNEINACLVNVNIILF